MIQENLVSPIDDFLDSNDKSDIYANDLSAIASNGKHYAWPLWVPPVGMYINLDIFQERGVTPPADDWTYEQFVEIAQKLTFTRSNGDNVYGYAAMIDPGVLNTWPFIMGDGGMPFNTNNTKYAFNSAEGISGLQKLVDLAQKYQVTPPDFGGSLAAADIITGFSQRKTYAMYSAPSGDSVSYQTAKLNFDVKPMPICGLGTHFTTGGVGLIAVASIQDANRLKAAMSLAKYLTSAQVQQDVHGYYLAPGARKSVIVTDPISKFTSFVPYTWLAPNLTQWQTIRSLIHPQLQKAVLGQISASAALNAPADDINNLLSGN
jgi:ABC-type glycerol-3-phosphate transport system substrate-binding protein